MKGVNQMLRKLFGGDPVAELLEHARGLGARGVVIIDPAEPPDGKGFIAALVKDHTDTTTADGSPLLVVDTAHKSPSLSDNPGEALYHLGQAITPPPPQKPCPQCTGAITTDSATGHGVSACPHCGAFLRYEADTLRIESDAEAGARVLAEFRQHFHARRAAVNDI